MKAKYYIHSYSKLSQSFLSMVNHNKETYEITLERINWMGFKKLIKKTISLPIGFNAELELIKGREYKMYKDKTE